MSWRDRNIEDMLEAADNLRKEEKENRMSKPMMTRDEAVDIITNSAVTSNKIIQEIIDLLEIEPNDDVRIIDFKLSILNVIKRNLTPFNEKHSSNKGSH